MKTLALTLSLGLLLPINALVADDKVIVHEWGTFTCLQDEQGRAIGGINVDDEPVPSFVSSVACSVAPQYLGSGEWGFANLGLPPYRAGKGWISGDPHVTMRLETPVIYFYPPKGLPASAVPPLNVHVDFHGGVLSQFYPHADFSGLPKLRFPGMPQDNIFPYVDEAMGITEATTTSLDWKGVQLGSTEKPIETDDKVWTTPRETGASVLQVQSIDSESKNGPKTYTQAEHFLFYRGVGHLDSPVTIQYLPQFGGKLTLVGRLADTTGNPDFVDHLNSGWVVRINAMGQCAFYAWPGGDIAVVSLGSGCYMPPVSGEFTTASFSSDNLTKLKSSMHDALVKEGLYDDEATAMLKTWELSYFKSPGLRFFYIVPRAWVDKVLPLKIVGPSTDITRVMVGRIELVTDAQKAALARLAAGPCPDLAALKKTALDFIDKGKFSDEEKQAFFSGEKPLSDLGIAIPPLVQDYLSMGRFRDALIVREQQQHPSAALAQFIKDNQLVQQEK